MKEKLTLRDEIVRSSTNVYEIGQLCPLLLRRTPNWALREMMNFQLCNACNSNFNLQNDHSNSTLKDEF